MKLFVVLSIILMIGSYAHATEEGDLQFWTNTKISFKMNQDWNFSFNEELRYEDDMDKLCYYHSDVGVSSSSLIDGVKTGFNYRLYNHRSDNGPWHRVHSPHINLTFKGKIFDVPVSNRCRFQFIDNKDKPDLWKFRNKVTIKLDDFFKIGGLKPYVSDEFFINLADDTQINRNRLSAGLSYKINSNTSINTFYLWQTSKSGNNWKDIDVIGLSLSIKF